MCECVKYGIIMEMRPWSYTAALLNMQNMNNIYVRVKVPQHVRS